VVSRAISWRSADLPSISLSLLFRVEPAEAELLLGALRLLAIRLAAVLAASRTALSSSIIMNSEVSRAPVPDAHAAP
jgi:hypothetical protein